MLSVSIRLIFSIFILSTLCPICRIHAPQYRVHIYPRKRQKYFCSTFDSSLNLNAHFMDKVMCFFHIASPTTNDHHLFLYFVLLMNLYLPFSATTKRKRKRRIITQIIIYVRLFLYSNSISSFDRNEKLCTCMQSHIDSIYAAMQQQQYMYDTFYFTRTCDHLLLYRAVVNRYVCGVRNVECGLCKTTNFEYIYIHLPITDNDSILCINRRVAKAMTEALNVRTIIVQTCDCVCAQTKHITHIQ